jgi:hypothetical protein
VGEHRAGRPLLCERKPERRERERPRLDRRRNITGGSSSANQIATNGANSSASNASLTGQLAWISQVL